MRSYPVRVRKGARRQRRAFFEGPGGGVVRVVMNHHVVPAVMLDMVRDPSCRPYGGGQGPSAFTRTDAYKKKSLGSRGGAEDAEVFRMRQLDSDTLLL